MAAKVSGRLCAGELAAVPSVASRCPASGEEWDHLLCSGSHGDLHFEDAVPVGRHSQGYVCPVCGG